MNPTSSTEGPTKSVRPAGFEPAEPSRFMGSTGCIEFDNPKMLDEIPLYYCAATCRWFSPSREVGRYVRIKDSTAAAYLAENGFGRRYKNDFGNSLNDRAQMWIMQNHAVSFAGALAGYRAGVHELNGDRILVTESPRLVVPAEGEFPTIERLILSLFADPLFEQASVLLTWLAESYRAFEERLVLGTAAPFRFAPVLGIFGPPACGKSAFVDLVLVPLFGGRKGDPMTYLTERRFNKDIIRTELLVLDDKGASASLTERRERGEAIKDMIWKPDQRLEGKGVDAITVRPFWRLIMVGNDDDAGLQMCPALGPGLDDKMILLAATKAEGLPTTREENDMWAKRIASELPAFAAWLRQFGTPAIPGHRLDERSRVYIFRHQRLEVSLRMMQPELRLLELLDLLQRKRPDAFSPYWQGTASEFEQFLRSEFPDVTDRLFASHTAAGRMLSELARIVPERVKRKDHSGISNYRLYCAQPKLSPLA
jgi:hypothetical protein